MWKWIRIPKGIALLAFLLPWMTVSCASQKVAEASGFGLAFGRINAMGQTSQADSGASMNLWLILSLVAIAGGLFLLFTRGREAAKWVIGTSAAAFVLIFVGTWRYSKDAILAEVAKNGGNGEREQAALAMIQIDWHFGYWLALLALIAAGVMAWLVMSGKEAEAEAKMRSLAADAADAAKVAAAKAGDAARDAAAKANDAIDAAKDASKDRAGYDDGAAPDGKDGDPPKP
ncbi:hypothetical protein MNQ96_14435 [Sphingopyxis granuli]|uniref:hypothetical protein n=1 Tax=Sphingopyxis granuli TaxID=267128 RepID=UPI001F52C453|nr:hypothetical protein [Sphingopyxis granuli]UNK78736.1 hypothetical protein MNQ96_14435 [Sphingopyxis granuli]